MCFLIGPLSVVYALWRTGDGDNLSKDKDKNQAVKKTEKRLEKFYTL